MNSITKRKLRKALRTTGPILVEWLLLLIMCWALTEASWAMFEKRLTYKECYVWKTKNCSE